MNTEFSDDGSDTNSHPEDFLDFDLGGFGTPLDSIANTQVAPGENFEVKIDRTVPHVTVMIEGIEVLFPFPPYEPQKAYMASVIQALNTRQNGLLQSPTGTGKTLCLLCASLAWMHKTKSKTQIFYSSRTHTQLKQVFEQLKKTCYRPITTILASRNLSCVKYKDQFQGAQLVGMCQVATGAKKQEEDIEDDEAVPPCGYFRRLKESEKLYYDQYSRALCDVEDLFKEGLKHGFCPYYLQKKIQTHANIVFVPYSYLINPFIRDRMNVFLVDRVVIFDEAHNIEKQVEEANSYEFSLQTLKKCQVYFENMNKLLQQDPDMTVRIQTKESRYEEKPVYEFVKLAELEIRQLEKPILNLLEAFMAVKEKLEARYRERMAKRTKFTQEEAKEIFQSTKLEAFIGRRIFEYYKNMKGDDTPPHFLDGVDQNNYPRFLEILEFAYANREQKLSRRGFKTLAHFSQHVFHLLIMDIQAKNKNVQFDYSQNYIESYKLCFSLETAANFDGENIPKYFEKDFFNLSIKLVCLNPGIGFANLNLHRPLSIILTSGTLTPLESFETELMTKFPIKLINDHVIDTKLQCKTFVVSQGPCQVSIEFSYANRDSQEMIQELGHSIIKIAEKVPNGMLVCFASYALKDRCVRIWKQLFFEDTNISILNKMISIKPIFEEAKSKARSDKATEEYKENSVRERGAFFFIICRGKVSEGIDLKEEMARAVLLVGLPLPPWKDPLINAKKSFLEDKKKRTREGLSGNDWYNQEATRAFNQAIGRVIRHKDDYGLVFLFDQRYGERRYLNQLSNWIQPNTEVPSTFTYMINKITPFFKRCERKFSGRGDDESMPIEEPSPPPIQFSPASTHFKLSNHYKREGSEVLRNSSEMKRVLKTQSEPSFPRGLIEAVNEFDISAENICDFILGSQVKLPRNEEGNQFSFQIFQNNLMSNVPKVNRKLFERGESMQSCDSSDPFCEMCQKQKPLSYFKSPSKDGRPVCDRCWGVNDDDFN